MKVKLDDDVNLNTYVNVEVSINQWEEIIDKVVEASLIVIAAGTVSHILKSVFKGES